MPYWSGALLVGVTVALTWVNDSSAYVIGHRWGRRKLIERVSPGKTVEGAVGALLVTVLAAVPTLWLVDRWVPLFDLADALAVGVLVGVAAPLGDLVESAFKRDAGVKDASDLVPGHGGVLDRFDSLMAVAPAFWYYLWLVVL
jgi:phosphatidate cytidylyltransferase